MLRHTLDLNSCLGLTKIDRKCYEITGDLQARAAGYSSYTDYLNKGGQTAQQWQQQNSGNNGGNVDVVANAQKLLDFQKTANAPVVASLQTQEPGIKDKYSQLVASIKGNQQLDTNRQTTTTNNLLAQRGITSNSNLGQQEMTNALTPIDTQYAGLTANANAGSIQDLQNLALQVAQLQAGNPDTAISGGLQVGGLQNQASSIASQNALNAAQAQLASQQGGFYGNQGAYYTALAKSLTGGNIPAAEQLRRQFGM